MTSRAHLLQEARRRKGISATQVAAMIGTDSSGIFKFEKGTRTITEQTILKYCEAGLITREEATLALLGPAA